jgi:hypothetical protein
MPKMLNRHAEPNHRHSLTFLTACGDYAFTLSVEIPCFLGTIFFQNGTNAEGTNLCAVFAWLHPAV